jgi:hypothetical protein
LELMRSSTAKVDANHFMHSSIQLQRRIDKMQQCSSIVASEACPRFPLPARPRSALSLQGRRAPPAQLVLPASSPSPSSPRASAFLLCSPIAAGIRGPVPPSPSLGLSHRAAAGPSFMPFQPGRLVFVLSPSARRLSPPRRSVQLPAGRCGIGPAARATPAH